MSWRCKRDVEHLSRPPSVTETDAAVRTSRLIREALQLEEVGRRRGLDIFLQGSYANSTNISGSSDVDVVARLEDVFYHDYVQGVKPETRALVEASHSSAEYTYQQYRSDLLAALSARFPGQVMDGRKAITVKGTASGTRLDADVIPCATFRMYQSERSFEEGICFWPTDGSNRIVNFPKQHKSNMADKNSTSRAGPKFKSIVRAMKRLRDEVDPIGNGIARRSASYWIECLMYNVADREYAGTYADALQNSIASAYAKLKADPSQFVQANDVYYLFHNSFWQVDSAIALLEEVWSHAFESVA